MDDQFLSLVTFFHFSDAYFSACDCGENIYIDGDGTIAKRTKGFNCGLVLLKPCLRAQQKFKVCCLYC